jgi:hypothetical protein
VTVFIKLSEVRNTRGLARTGEHRTLLPPALTLPPPTRKYFFRGQENIALSSPLPLPLSNKKIGEHHDFVPLPLTLLQQENIFSEDRRTSRSPPPCSYPPPPTRKYFFRGKENQLSSPCPYPSPTKKFF